MGRIHKELNLMTYPFGKRKLSVLFKKTNKEIEERVNSSYFYLTCQVGLNQQQRLQESKKFDELFEI